MPQNEAGAPENRIVVLRTCPDAPSRNLHPVLGPVVTARAGSLPFPSGCEHVGAKNPVERSASGAPRVGYAIVKLTVTVRIASKPIGAYFHCLRASIADCANASFVDRRTVMSPIVPSA